MSLWDAFIIGFVQGLTEFFPISSSSHLKLIKMVLGVDNIGNSVYFDLICHLGTLTAALYFFRRDIFEIFTQGREKFRLFFIALLPLIPCYFLLKPLREFASRPEYLGYALLATGAILFLGTKIKVRNAEGTTSK